MLQSRFALIVINDKCISTQHLLDLHHTVRCQCLLMIGALSVPDKTGSKKDEKKCQRLLVSHIDDHDPRVRESALQSMVCRHTCLPVLYLF